MRVCAVLLVICVVKCYGQNEQDGGENVTLLNLNTLTDNIGNFSIELLYHTAQLQTEESNIIMSPFTVWTALAVILEGASENTSDEIADALRLPRKQSIRNDYRAISPLLVNTSTVELTTFNGIFIDTQYQLLPDFQELAKKYYDTFIVTLNFSDNERSAELLNAVISNFTHERIPNLVESSNFNNAKMFLTNAVYFRGQWASPFNATFTKKELFFDSTGNTIGEVNMMYNRHNYPFLNKKDFKASMIELPYDENQSMIIMLPNPGVTLEDMFENFQQVPLESLFEELRLAKEEYAYDKVDCFIPRFKIESNIDLTEVLRSRMNIRDLFNMNEATLPYMARTPLHVSKVIHKAEIEVTEKGTVALAVNTVEFTSRTTITRFEANRPFAYMIIEKVTRTVVFGGFYKEPFLY